MKYVKKPIPIECVRWFKLGDHPNVTKSNIQPDIICSRCNKTHLNHGYIDTLEGGHQVCPGDWIATGIKGENWPIKPDIFALTYEEYEEHKDVDYND